MHRSIPTLAAIALSACAAASASTATNTAEINASNASSAHSASTPIAHNEARVDSAALAARLQTKLDSVRAAGHFPGATLAVALPDGRVIAVATGYADSAGKIPLRITDRLLEGSVGKTYVSAIAMQLVQSGKLLLDDKIEQYLGTRPWFSRLPNAHDITVRELMNHTSGLVRYEFNDNFTKALTASPDKAWTPEEEVAFILDSKPPFAAGQGWDYSDTNYIVLGMIIEQLTGEPYYTSLRTRLLRPFHLDNTVPSEGRRIPGLAQGYAGSDNPFGHGDAMLGADGTMIINPQFEWTGGGVAATTADLARWGKLLYEWKAFDVSMRDQFLDAVPAPYLGPHTRYGLGVIVRDSTPLGVAWGHSGFFPGYLTEMMYYPRYHFAAAIQFNDSAPRATGRHPVVILWEASRIVADALEGR